MRKLMFVAFCSQYAVVPSRSKLESEAIADPLCSKAFSHIATVFLSMKCGYWSYFSHIKRIIFVYLTFCVPHHFGRALYIAAYCCIHPILSTFSSCLLQCNPLRVLFAYLSRVCVPSLACLPPFYAQQSLHYGVSCMPYWSLPVISIVPALQSSTLLIVLHLCVS